MHILTCTLYFFVVTGKGQKLKQIKFNNFILFYLLCGIGVQGIHIDTEEGLVIVTGLLDPAIIMQKIGKLGIEAELLAYEKDPKKAKKKLDHFLKGNSKDNKRNLEEIDDHDHDDRGGYEYDARYAMPNCTSCHHPNYGTRRVLPGFPRPNCVHPINQPVIYNRPPPPPRYVRWTRPPLPYPFSIYEPQGQDVGNAPHHTLSDENVSVCSVM